MSEMTFNEININILKQLLDQTCTVLTLSINVDNIKLIIDNQAYQIQLQSFLAITGECQQL